MSQGKEKECVLHVEYTMYGTVRVKAETLQDAYLKIQREDFDPEKMHVTDTDLLMDKEKTYNDNRNAAYLLK